MISGSPTVLYCTTKVEVGDPDYHHHNYHYRHHNLLLIITNVIIRRHCLKFHHDCWTESYACSADLPSPSLLQKVLIGLCLRKYSLQSMAQIRISFLLSYPASATNGSTPSLLVLRLRKFSSIMIPLKMMISYMNSPMIIKRSVSRCDVDRFFKAGINIELATEVTTKETSVSKFFQLQRSVFAIVIDRPQSRKFHDVTPTPV